jgi:undecaprenyl diphosphate synthase
MDPQIAHGSTTVPRHVAIIMDGNGRWASARGLPRAIGHKYGAETVRKTVEASIDLGIEYLTLFGFSSENWNRPLGEVSDLMGLLRRYLSKEMAELQAQGVRIRIIGERERLEPDIVSLIEQSEKLTEGNTTLNLTLALSYGGRSAIALAARRIAEQVRSGLLKPDMIGEEQFERHLETVDLPDPDLLIRTSGEKRISNFMLWECAYSEFVFLDTLWPDFSRDQLAEAIEEFGRRNGSADDSRNFPWALRESGPARGFERRHSASLGAYSVSRWLVFRPPRGAGCRRHGLGMDQCRVWGRRKGHCSSSRRRLHADCSRFAMAGARVPGCRSAAGDGAGILLHFGYPEYAAGLVDGGNCDRLCSMPVGDRAPRRRDRLRIAARVLAHCIRRGDGYGSLCGGEIDRRTAPGSEN